MLTKGLILAMLVSVSWQSLCAYTGRTFWYADSDLAFPLTFTKKDINGITVKDYCDTVKECKYVLPSTTSEKSYLTETQVTDFPAFVKSKSETGFTKSLNVWEKQTCSDSASYAWQTESSVESCPTDLRKVLSIYTPFASSSQECKDCWDATDQKCYMSTKKYCKLPTLASFSSDATMTSPASTTGPFTDIFQGEAVTFTCKGDKLFMGDAPVDSNTKTVVLCKEENPGSDKVTDIPATWNKIKCADPCNSMSYDTATQTIDTAITFPTRSQSKIKVNCKPGYGFDDGSEKIDVGCSSTVTSKSCLRCDPPTSFSFSTFASASAKPTETLTQSCERGYSFEGTATTSKVYTCDDNGKLTSNNAEPSDCTENCPVTLQTDQVSDKDVTNGLPVGQTATLSCNTGKLAVSQSYEIECTVAGTTLTPAPCKPTCLTDGLKIANTRTVKIGSTFLQPSTTEVPQETKMTIECQGSNALAFGKTADFECSDTFYDFTQKSWNIPGCLSTCNIGGTNNAKSYNLLEANGDVGSAIIVGESIPDGRSIQITCKDGMTVVDSELSTQVKKCQNGQSISPNTCATPCQMTELGPITKNTQVLPDSTSVGAGQSLTFKCSAGFTLGGSDNTEENTAVECKPDPNDSTLYKIQPAIPSSTSICFGDPTITDVKVAGAETLSVKVNVPSTYDQVNTKIKSAVVTLSDTSGQVEKITMHSSLLTDKFTALQTTGSTEVNFKNKAEIRILSIQAEIAYDWQTVKVPKTVSKNDVQFGPPAVDSPQFTATGRDKILIRYANTGAFNNAKSKVATYTSLKLKIEFCEKGTTKVLNTIEDIELSSLADTITAPTQVTGLNEATTYDVKITSIVPTGYGGTLSGSVKTGYDAPSLKEEVLTSTSNKLTITLANANTFSGSLFVSIDGTKKNMIFASGVASETLTGLTAKVEYTKNVIVFSDDVPSGTASITFRQGPSEVVFLTPVLTHNTLLAKWTVVPQNTYYVSLQQTDNTEVKPEVTTTEGSLLFGGLSPGTQYKVVAKAEMTIDGKAIFSGETKSQSYKTYDCAVADKSSNYKLYTVNSVKEKVKPLEELYVYADLTVEFLIECPSNFSFEVSDKETADIYTSCEGPGKWTSHSNCKRDAAEVSSGTVGTGGIVGIVIAVVLVLIIIIVIIVLIKRKKRKGSDSKRSKKYSPRDEEKNNDKAVEGGETWKNPYYQDHNEKNSPTTPDNRDVNGDNVSQEAKLDFNEEDTPDVVIANDNTYDTAEHNA